MPAWTCINLQWFKNFTENISIMIKDCLDQIKKTPTNIHGILDMILFNKKTIPKSLRIYDSFFTRMILCSDVNVSSYMEQDIENKDILTCIVSLGEVKYNYVMERISVCPTK